MPRLSTHTNTLYVVFLIVLFIGYICIQHGIKQTDVKHLSLYTMSYTNIAKPSEKNIDKMIDQAASRISSFWLRPYDSAVEIVQASVEASKLVGIPVSLLLGIIAKESSFDVNTKNFSCHDRHLAKARCKRLDLRKPHGLMQISGKYHKDKFIKVLGGLKQASIKEHILIGAMIVDEYLKQYGNVLLALQAYNGNLKDAQQRYAHDVMRFAFTFAADLNETDSLRLSYNGV